LEEEFGRPEVVHSHLNSKLANFPKLGGRDNKKLFDLVDLLMEIEAVKENPIYQTSLSYFDTASGIKPILGKLAYGIQEKWVNECVKYKKLHNVMHPPFAFFTKFVHRLAQVKNDPCFETYQSVQDAKPAQVPTKVVTVRKTEVPPESRSDSSRTQKICPIHETNHSLNDCKVFRNKPIGERKQFLKEKGLCFKCCGTLRHLAKDCRVQTVTCGICKKSHPTGLHVEEHGGESRESQQTEANNVTVQCTQLCVTGASGGRSCAKIVLVKVYPKGQPHLFRTMYAIVDDQSNRSLAKSEFFEMFKETGPETPYSLLSCAGSTVVSGRRANGYIIESLQGYKLDLPTLIECNDIPDNRAEIPTPEVARQYTHLKDIASLIPPIDGDANISLLLGRDIIKAHQVLDQRIGPGNSPYGQRLHLGWVIIGEVCLGKVHRAPAVNVKKTFVMNNGQHTLFPPCNNNFTIKECNLEGILCEPDSQIFMRAENDNKPGKSTEDREFEKVMSTEMCKNQEGHWEAPLPFRTNRKQLPNNIAQAKDRARLLETSLRKNERKKEHFFTFMNNLLEKGFAEVAPPIQESSERWYLPIFGVYHPRKPSQIRVVFDASAQYQGTSLNQILLPGPNLTNDLLGVLMRFRQGQIAVTADIQQMFYAFHVKGNHRDYLRFLWYKDNDINKELIEYRMTVHVFGNSTSPAVATYALRQTVDDSDQDVKQFVNKQFYVDDGLLSMDSVEEAVDLVKRTQWDLQTKGGLKLHKIASNCVDLMKQFTNEELTKELQSLNFTEEYLPFHQSLGLSWDLNNDLFTFIPPEERKPFTRRGLLAVINSVYDPIGFLAPVLIRGKMMLREVTNSSIHWDDELPIAQQNQWKLWLDSLADLNKIRIPRTYASVPSARIKSKQIHIFCDASEKAIAAVAYLKSVDLTENTHIGFVLGKAKLAPSHGHTLPRLELCAAVLAIEVAELVKESLAIPATDFTYHTDSKVVLGYIYNNSRRFYNYVSNRVDRIKHASKPTDWCHVKTEDNPADLGTRSVAVETLQDSSWLQGPTCLRQTVNCDDSSEQFPMIEPDQDKEVRSCKTRVNEDLGVTRFSNFSTWQSLVNALKILQRFTRKFKAKGKRIGIDSYGETQLAESLIIKTTQNHFYSEEMEQLLQGKPVPKNSPIKQLNPFLDENGLLRVGGRIENACVSYVEAHPVILPGKSHVALLITRSCHEQSPHQGRLITEGAIRTKGYWITGVKRLIGSMLRQCVKCKRLRGKEQCQIMGVLPEDRLKVQPPFSSIGVDVFGPWEVITRKTRGGAANSKRWAALFTCLSTRAVHIEVLESMSTSSFINAFRRLVALRGKVNIIRSDQGTNFVGAEKLIKGVKWIFNTPHASHMGGVWERMIGVSRRVLDAMFQENSKNITHEVLVTLMAEVSAVINSRPITEVSTDPEDPVILSPAMLLTHRGAEVQQNLTNIDIRDLYREQWKRVQVLTEYFWNRWRREYLNTLQKRQKWTQQVPDIRVGDVVLLKDRETVRGDWPIARISEVIPSDNDRRVRKVVLTTFKDGKRTTFQRPITELVLLVKD
jgi:hypothetical protein